MSLDVGMSWGALAAPRYCLVLLGKHHVIVHRFEKAAHQVSDDHLPSWVYVGAGHGVCPWRGFGFYKSPPTGLGWLWR